MDDIPRPPGRLDLEEFWKDLVACQNQVPSLLRMIAQRVVDLLGDGCVLTTVTEDGTALRPRVVLHAQPEIGAAMTAVLGESETPLGEGLAGTVARDRRPIMLSGVDPQELDEVTPERYLPFLRDHPMQAIIIVPMTASGELVGTLGSIRTSSSAPYTLADLRLLEELAERAALAIAEALAAPRAIGCADYEAIFRFSMDGVLLTTPDGHILAANPSACAILGLSERQIVDGGRDAVIVADDPRLARALAQRAATGRARAELAMRRGEGSIFVADVSSTIFTTPEGKVRSCVIFRDISDEAATRDRTLARVAELEQVADRDDLTALWNRRGFAVAAEQALAAADRQGTVSQVLFIDLDSLKATNDTHGHAVGDAVIIAVAAAIDRTVRDVDVAARLGGDEFVVLLTDTAADEVPAIIDRMRRALASDEAAPPMAAFSTGVAERPPRTDSTLADLVSAADREMYQQKVLRRLRRG